MIISLIYFNCDLPSHRAKHKLYEEDLKRWLHYYERFKSFPVVILTDHETQIPKFWTHDVLRISTDFPKQKDFLNKVGLMKCQAYQTIGKTLIMDLDTIIMDSIEELNEVDCELAMVDDHVPTKWDSFLQMRKKNAGVIISNKDVFDDFMEIWNQNNIFDNVTFKDEIIFSLLSKKYKYAALDSKYNCCNPALQAKIYHFHGKNKRFLKDFPCST